MSVSYLPSECNQILAPGMANRRYVGDNSKTIALHRKPWEVKKEWLPVGLQDLIRNLAETKRYSSRRQGRERNGIRGHQDDGGKEIRNVLLESGVTLSTNINRCLQCTSGDPNDGGVNIPAQGMCTAYCTAKLYCGDGAEYTQQAGIIDCSRIVGDIRRSLSSKEARRNELSSRKEEMDKVLQRQRKDTVT